MAIEAFLAMILQMQKVFDYANNQEWYQEIVRELYCDIGGES